MHAHIHWSDASLLIVLQVPKPPKKDFYKLMNKDKIVLRFSTRFVETPTHQLSSSDRSDHPSTNRCSCSETQWPQQERLLDALQHDVCL